MHIFEILILVRLLVSTTDRVRACVRFLPSSSSSLVSSAEGYFFNSFDILFHYSNLLQLGFQTFDELTLLFIEDNFCEIESFVIRVQNL
jgi:hypothetical protein